jgi:hypothetical protein
VDLSLRIDIWHWFSLDQAISATTLSRKAGELEANPRLPSEAEKARGLKWSEDDQREHRSYVTASILSSVTFLEASINELFASARYDNLEVGGKLSQPERDHLTGAAEMLANNRLLDRFQLALYLLDRTPFDRGAQPYQDAQALVNLRNELVHYKPQFRTGASEEPVEVAKWIKGLADKRFSVNPFTGDQNPFFPDRCLSHGCTVWAWNAALMFCDEFFNRVGVKAVYDSQRQTLIP